LSDVSTDFGLAGHVVQGDEQSNKRTLFNALLGPMRQTEGQSQLQTSQQMLQFDFNKNPITLRCRLYIIKALIYRGWDRSGKADPFIKIALNDEVIIDDVGDKIQNTLEPVFGKCVDVCRRETLDKATVSRPL
jgi:hypothetical protein